MEGGNLHLRKSSCLQLSISDESQTCLIRSCNLISPLCYSHAPLTSLILKSCLEPHLSEPWCLKEPEVCSNTAGCSLCSPTCIRVDTHLLPHLPLAMKTPLRVQLLTNLKLDNSVSRLRTQLHQWKGIRREVRNCPRQTFLAFWLYCH